MQYIYPAIQTLLNIVMDYNLPEGRRFCIHEYLLFFELRCALL